MPLKIYQPQYPLNADITFLARVWREYYLRYPILTYRVLQDNPLSHDEDYLDADREERHYEDHQMNLRIALGSDNEEINLSNVGIDRPKIVMFYACYPFCEDLGIEPKIGDVILFEYDEPIEYEVRTVRKPVEATFAHSNYWFERELKAERAVHGE